VGRYGKAKSTRSGATDMAIPFSCECGKKLQAKDEFAGRKMKCPNCGRVLTIPHPARTAPANAAATQAKPRPVAAETMPLPAKAPPPQPTASPPLVRFVCSCGRKMKARQSDAGSEIDCPTCGRELTIPPHDTEVAPEPKFGPVPVMAPVTTKGRPAPPTSRQLPIPLTSRLSTPDGGQRAAPPPSGDGLFGQATAPWLNDEFRRLSGASPKEKPVRKLWPAALLVLLVCGLVGAAWVEVPHGTKSTSKSQPSFAELDMVPSNAISVVSMRIPPSAAINVPILIPFPAPGPPPKGGAGAIPLPKADKEPKAEEDRNPPPDKTPMAKLASAINAPIGWPENDLERITVAVSRKPVQLTPINVKLPGGGDKKKSPGGDKKAPPGGDKKKPPGGDKKNPPAVDNSPPLMAVYFVHTKKPYSQLDVFHRVFGTTYPEFVQQGKRKIYFVDQPIDDAENTVRKAVFFVDSRLFLVGSPESIQNLVKAGPLKEGPLRKALEAAPKHDLVVGDISEVDGPTPSVLGVAIWVDETRVDEKLDAKIHFDYVLDDQAQAEKFQGFVDNKRKSSKVKYDQEESKLAVQGIGLTIDLHASGDAAADAWADVRHAVTRLTPQPPWAIPKK
jgi:predicted RNA-binding Zn-ribbon protein involved in translation (DUF1610 family)